MDATTTAAITDGFDGVKDLATTLIIPAVFGLTLLGVGVALAQKAIRKNGSRVGG